MKRKLLPLLAVPAIVLLMSGCLTVEKKLYTFKFTEGDAGTLTIKYVNIMSVKDDTLNVSVEDFEELISTYIDGEEIELDFPYAQVVSKKLFEDEGVLCGEIVFEFEYLAAINLYQYKKSGPYMYCLNCSLDSETYEYSNGTYGEEIMPVVFWESDLPVLNLASGISYPDESMVSLLPLYEEWIGK